VNRRPHSASAFISAPRASWQLFHCQFGQRHRVVHRLDRAGQRHLGIGHRARTFHPAAEQAGIDVGAADAPAAAGAGSSSVVSTGTGVGLASEAGSCT
jgi:hypothetical protein